MAHSSWAWANENYQGPKKSMKKSHEHHNNDSNNRTLQKYRTRKVELSEMGFFTPSLMNHFFLINVFY